jgi:hypothetical protein
MADVVDDAGEYNEIYQAAAFRAAGISVDGTPSPALAPQTHPDFDGVHCVDCEIEIPAKRLAWGRVRCTDCESILELKKRTVGTR